MIFKTPLGLIALVGILILLIIYLIKPTYQAKIISTSYIWRESLKYKKNRRPTSKLMNLFRIFIEILIIADLSLILATPFILGKGVVSSKEEAIIIDSSYSMNIGGEYSRLSRAKAKAMEIAKEAVSNKKSVSIINLNKDASFILSKENDLDLIAEAINSIKSTYYTAEVDKAMSLINEAARVNPTLECSFITDKEYKDSNDVKIYSVRDSGDFNSAILNATATLLDNYYEFSVDLISLGDNRYVNLYLKANGINNTSASKEFKERVNTRDGIKETIKFKNLGIYSYEGIEIHLEPDGGFDSLPEDDYYYLPGSYKDKINVEYFSLRANSFVSGALNTLANKYSEYFDIDIKIAHEASELETSGYDFYIFEHKSPAKIPTDGVSLIINPDTLPRELGINLLESIRGSFSFKKGIESEITANMDIAKIEASMYKPLLINEDNEALIKYNDDVILSRNKEARALVLAINLNESNLPLLIEFPVLINNIFSSYIKPITYKDSFTVGEEIRLSTRGKQISLEIDGEAKRYNDGDIAIIEAPGLYEATELLLNNKKNKKKILVRVDNTEIMDESLINNDPYLFTIKRDDAGNIDIYLYLSITLLALLLLDKMLRSKRVI